MASNETDPPRETAGSDSRTGPLSRRGSAHAGRFRRLVIALGLMVIFMVAARARFGLPPEPMIDPDSFGYMGPLFSWLRGDGFWQADGRAHLYPLFLWAVVLATHGFVWITTVQHAVGLLSGAAGCWAWWLWMSFLPPGVVRRWVAPMLGLAALAIYLWGSRSILFEHMVRPEAVFPGVGLLQIAFGLAFAKARWMGGSRRAIIAYAAAGIVAAGIALNLKPSWGLAGLLPFVLVAASFWRANQAARLCGVFGLCLGVVVASVPLVILPGIAGWKRDRRSQTFLAETLASVHARIIAASLEDRARRGLLDPEESRFAEDFCRTVRAAVSVNKSYPVLGVDCDEILYRSGLFERLPCGASASSKTAGSYLLGLYFQALRDRPAAFVGKWKDQFRLAYLPEPRDLFRPRLRLRLNYALTLASERPEIRGNLPAEWEALWQSYWRSCRDLAANAPEQVSTSLNVPPSLVRFAAAILLPALIFLPAFAAAGFFIAGRLSALRPAAAASLVPAAVSFAATASVAIVHSFDLDRYLNLLIPADLFVIACASSLLAACAGQVFSPLRGRFSDKTAGNI